MASWYAIRARGTGAEVAIYDEIGAYGVSAKGFLAELGALPETKMPRQRGDGGAWAFQCADDISLDRAPEPGDINPILGHACPQAEVPHEGGQRDRAKASGQPVAEPPVRTVGPDAGQFREERIGPCIPGPGGAFRDMNHPVAID